MAYTVHKLLSLDQVGSSIEVQNMNMPHSADNFPSEIGTEFFQHNITQFHDDVLVYTTNEEIIYSPISYVDTDSSLPGSADPHVYLIQLFVFLGVSCFLLICWIGWATWLLVCAYQKRKKVYAQEQREANDRKNNDGFEIVAVDTRPTRFLPTFLRKNNGSNKYYKPVKLIKTS